MFLASLLSVLAGAWMFAAAPFTVTMKSAGYSARSDGKTVTVTRVEPKSVAAEAGLQKGMKVTGIDQPSRAFFVKVPLAQLDAADLQDALTPQPEEALWLRVETRQGPDQRILKSREPLPDNPFPVMPLTAAQLARLTPMQQSRYLQLLAFDTFRRPRIDVSQRTTAYVLKGKLSGVEGGGATPLWLHPNIQLGISCSNPEQVELSGAVGPMNLTPRPEDVRASAASFHLVPPVWPVQQILQQCERPAASLDKVLHVKVTCKDVSPAEQDVTLTLNVRCEGHLSFIPQPPLLVWEPQDFLVGDKTPLQVEVFAHKLIPRPAEVSLVELDSAGKVTRRLRSLPMGKDADAPGLPVQVTLDTTTSRTVRLALEARYSDGSTWLSEPQTREVRTPAQVEELRRKRVAARARETDFLESLHDKFNAPCNDLPTTMKWIRAHPAIESASGGGREISYKVKGHSSFSTFLCDYD